MQFVKVSKMKSGWSVRVHSMVYSTHNTLSVALERAHRLSRRLRNEGLLRAEKRLGGMRTRKSDGRQLASRHFGLLPPRFASFLEFRYKPGH